MLGCKAIHNPIEQNKKSKESFENFFFFIDNQAHFIKDHKAPLKYTRSIHNDTKQKRRGEKKKLKKKKKEVPKKSPRKKKTEVPQNSPRNQPHNPRNQKPHHDPTSLCLYHGWTPHN
jgi:hypothetical protein